MVRFILPTHACMWTHIHTYMQLRVLVHIYIYKYVYIYIHIYIYIYTYICVHVYTYTYMYIYKKLHQEWRPIAYIRARFFAFLRIELNEWVVSNMWTSHVIYLNKSCHTCEGALSHNARWRDFFPACRNWDAGDSRTSHFVTYLIHMRDMTHSRVWRDAFTYVIQPIHMRDTTDSHLRRNSCTSAIMSASNNRGTYGREILDKLPVWHDSITRATWLISHVQL